MMNADGSNQIRLTTNPARDYLPKWTPDGRIAFWSERDGEKAIFVMNTDGTNVTKLTSPYINSQCWSYQWSADGTKIAFDSNRDGSWEIYTMNSDGSNVARLTNNQAQDQLPEWSPDGTKIAFTSKRDGNLEIYMMNIDGTNQTRLTNNPAIDDSPAWAP
jgi:TolB protein